MPDTRDVLRPSGAFSAQDAQSLQSPSVSTSSVGTPTENQGAPSVAVERDAAQLPTLESLRALIRELDDAQFSCGEWHADAVDEDDDGSYDRAHAFAQKTEDALIAAIQQLHDAARKGVEDTELLGWAAAHPEKAMGAITGWWAVAGTGGRELRFEFRNILRAARNGQ